jgi:hypothetical protein
MTVRKGSARPGPSKTYVRLIEGKITSQTYAKAVTRSVGAKNVKK